MKIFYLLACFILTLIVNLEAQLRPGQIYLKNGASVGDNNLLSKRFSGHNFQSLRYQTKVYTILRFGRLPSPAEKSSLKQEGVELYDYLPGNVFLAEISE